MIKLITKNFEGDGFTHDDNCPVCRVMRELGLEGEIVDLDDLTPEEREKLQAAFEEAKKIEVVPQELPLIEVTVRYGKTLKKITGRKEEKIQVVKGTPFLLFLKVIFDLHPEIEKRFPPGVLGFTLEGKAPGEFDILKDGDTVKFGV